MRRTEDGTWEESFLGPNGAGKTTLIKTILGLVKPAAGQVSIYGRPYEEQRRLVGYVPQRGSVDWDFPTNAFENLVSHMKWDQAFGERVVRYMTRHGLVQRISDTGLALTDGGRELAQQVMLR